MFVHVPYEKKLLCLILTYVREEEDGNEHAYVDELNKNKVYAGRQNHIHVVIHIGYSTQ